MATQRPFFQEMELSCVPYRKDSQISNHFLNVRIGKYDNTDPQKVVAYLTVINTHQISKTGLKLYYYMGKILIEIESVIKKIINLITENWTGGKR